MSHKCECGRKAKWLFKRRDDATHNIAACGQHLNSALGWLSKGYEVTDATIIWVYDED